MTTLAYLNELRAQNNKSPLKVWKESKAKLEAAIAKEETNNQLAKEEIAKAAQVPAEKVNVTKRTQTAIKKATKILDRAQGKTVNVAAIAKELGINPKVARAKVRKADIDRNDAKAIRKLLTK